MNLFRKRKIQHLFTMARLENKHCFACVLEKWPFPWQLCFAGTWNRAALLSLSCVICQLCKKPAPVFKLGSKGLCLLGGHESYLHWVIFPRNNVLSFTHVRKHNKCLTVWPRHPLRMWETQIESLLCLHQCPASDMTLWTVGVVIPGGGLEDPCLTQNSDLCPL